MGVITISRGSYSKGKEIAEKLAQHLGYECISREILLETSDHFNMRNFIMAALAVLFSINGVASAAQDGIFEIEAEGSYRMEAGASIDLAKKMALFTAKRKAVDLAGRYLSRQSHNSLYFA
jgi:hypothetical protein